MSKFTLTPATDQSEESSKFTLTPATDQSEEEVSTFGDIAQGVGAGAVGLFQGIAETAALVPDLAFGTDTASSVTKGFEATKDYLGLTPETTAGKTAEALTTFGAALIPVIGWVGRASSVARGASVLPSKSILKSGADAFGRSKAGKALLGSESAFTARAKLAATTSLAGGATEMIVAPDGTHTLSDSFDILPDALETEVDSGLQGRDEAARRLRNKLRMGIEGTALGLGFEAAFPVLGTTTRAISSLPGVPATARAVSGGFDYLGNKLSGAFEGKVGKYFTAAGETRKDIFENIRTIENVTDSDADVAAKLFASFDKEARKVVGGQKLLGRGKEGVQQAYDNLLLFLEGDVKALDQYGKAVVSAGTKMRSQIDSLTDLAVRELEIGIESGQMNRDLAQAAISELQHNKGSYLRRLYEGAFSDGTVSLSQIRKKPAYQRAVDSIADRIYKANAEDGLTREEAVAQAKVEVDSHFVKGALDEGISSPEALKLIERAATQGAKQAKEKPLYKLSEGLFKKRSKFLDVTPALRELMNEVRDPQELYLKTVSDISKFVSTNRFYKQLNAEKLSYEEATEALNRGAKPLVISGENVGKKQAQTLRDFGYTQFGKFKTIEGKGAGKTIFSGKYGPLSGEYVPIELKAALTAPARASNLATETLAIALQAKGISQMSKTVLNPVSQVRNFGSGTFMALANGNLPRTAEMGAAFDGVFKKINALSDEEADNFYRMIGDLGLVDENLAVNEMKSLLRESQGLKTEKVATSINSMIERVPGVKALQKIYSDTDTYWKTVGFLGEKAKYSAALRKSGLDPENIGGDVGLQLVRSGLAPRSSELTGRYGFLDVFASDIVKETMPIYSRVPDVIKGIRRIPVAGNFVAFPAEVLRNSTNIVRRGSRELGFKASDDLIQSIKTSRNLTDEQAIAAARQLEKEIRAIGANRLTSYISSAFVIPATISRTSYAATDVSEEEVNKMKPLLPDYMQGSQLMSLAAPKNGKWEHADLSYIMPYDFALAPARRAMQIYQEKGSLNASEVEQVGGALWGAFSSFMEPFASESLIAERVQDALPQNYFGRGGETATGSPVWNDANDLGTKMRNSFLHVMGGFNPAIVEMLVKPTAAGFEQGRVSAAITGDPTRTGREFNVHEEAFTAASGVRKLELDASKSLSFKGYEFTELRSQSLGNFTRVAKANNTTEEDILQAYRSANDDAFRAQRQMFGFIKAAEAAGLDEQQIITALKRDSNLGTRELGMLIQGKFLPVNISSNTVKDVYMETEVKGEPRKLAMLPVRKLKEQFQQNLGRPLAAPDVEVEEAPSIIDLSSVPLPDSQATQQPAAPTTAPAQPVQQQGQAQPSTRTNPAFLGSDIFSAMKNMMTFGQGRQ